MSGLFTHRKQNVTLEEIEAQVDSLETLLYDFLENVYEYPLMPNSQAANIGNVLQQVAQERIDELTKRIKILESKRAHTSYEAREEIENKISSLHTCIARLTEQTERDPANITNNLLHRAYRSNLAALEDKLTLASKPIIKSLTRNLARYASEDSDLVQLINTFNGRLRFVPKGILTPARIEFIRSNGIQNDLQLFIDLAIQLVKIIELKQRMVAINLAELREELISFTFSKDIFTEQLENKKQLDDSSIEKINAIANKLADYIEYQHLTQIDAMPLISPKDFQTLTDTSNISIARIEAITDAIEAVLKNMSKSNDQSSSPATTPRYSR